MRSRSREGAGGDSTERGSKRRIPLGIKWAVSMGLLIAVTMALTTVYVESRQRAALMDQVMGYGGSLAKFMASESAVPVLSEEWATLGEFVNTSVSGQDFSYMVVVDHQGIVRGSSNSEQVGQPYRGPDRFPARSGAKRCGRCPHCRRRRPRRSRFRRADFVSGARNRPCAPWHF